MATALLRSHTGSPLFSALRGTSEMLRVKSSDSGLGKRAGRVVFIKSIQISSRITAPGTVPVEKQNKRLGIQRDKKVVPDADPPSLKDVNLLCHFIDQSKKLVVMTGAGMSTECGIPDYRSPNGAYSSGFRPITHQEFTRFRKARRRYWARSYAGWRKFTAAQPSPAHHALASLEEAGRINFMITQNVDSRELFQEELKALNPKWAAAIESLDHGSPGSDKSFGMKQRPDGDIEIDEKFWEEDFNIPICQKCRGVLKPDVIFFGDNVPKDRADRAMEAAKGCDAFLILGSSMMTMSAFRLIKAAHEAGAATAIVNIGATRADDIVPLKINARLGEILPRVLNTGSLSIPAL